MGGRRRLSANNCVRSHHRPRHSGRVAAAHAPWSPAATTHPYRRVLAPVTDGAPASAPPATQFTGAAHTTALLPVASRPSSVPTHHTKSVPATARNTAATLTAATLTVPTVITPTHTATTYCHRC